MNKLERLTRMKADIEKLEQEFKEEEDKKNKYLIKKGADYFSMDRFGTTCNVNKDKIHLLLGNRTGSVFKTNKEMINHVKYMEIDAKIRRFARDYNKDWKADWDDHDQKKFFICYDNRNKEIDIYHTYSRESCGCILFKNSNALNALGKLFCDDREIEYWLKYEKTIYDLE